MRVIPDCSISPRLVLPLLAAAFGALLIAMPDNCFAREHAIGARLNTGLSSSWGSGYLAVGLGFDVSINQHAALMIDGQGNGNPDGGYQTLVIGVWLRATPTHKLCPYLTLAGGVWSDPLDNLGGAYSYAGPGMLLRFSQTLGAFVETRIKLFMEDNSTFRVKLPFLLGVRIAF